MAPETRSLSPQVLAIAVVLVVVTFLYSVFVAAAPLAWVGAVVPLVALYLLWRFVRAHERVAAAMEAHVGTAADGEPGTAEE